MLLLDPTRIPERRAVAAGPLAPLARSLAAELEPLLGRAPFVPDEKARMTRLGGRCPADGTLLDFDPWSPREHRCPRCGAAYREDEHHRWWIMSYQLWLAERAVHGAVLALVGEDARPGALADSILRAYADRYLAWPNVDNVLGPTRPFFSTYLESIWLLQLCVALDLREAAGGDPALGAMVRERLVAPSRALIAGYDEGLSNRQTWNDAALLAASLVLGDREGAVRAVTGASGMEAHLRHGLLADGTWYEGENYHLFAHRALWYGVTMAERAGIPLEPALVRRFEDAFAAPFASALPDLTFPSRRDSQYGISLRQWRFAELCELGLARRDDPRLAGALARLYAPDLPTTETGRARSTAEAERHAPATALDRASLGWKSLLCARAELPPLVPRAPGSVLLEGQGLSVVRRDAGAVYVALDYGHSGGGHGHPDRLNLLLVDGDTRWLDDYGTGSYVDPSLHWYRSTLAHNAPLVDERSQRRVHGRLVAHEERGGAGWTEAEAPIAEGVVVRRTVVVMPDYLVDVVAWRGERTFTLDLPIHADGEVAGAGEWLPLAQRRDAPFGSQGLEDGFRFLKSVEFATGAGAAMKLAASSGEMRADAFLSLPGSGTLWRAVAPGAPGAGARRFHAVRVAAAGGADAWLATVWSWRGSVASVRCVPERSLVVQLADGTRHEHARVEHGWHVDLFAAGARSSIDLGGLRAGRAEAEVSAQAGPGTDAREPLVVPREDGRGAALRLAMAEEHYRPSEQDWRESGCPAASVELSAGATSLVVVIHVHKLPRAFAAASDHNPLDNERPDVNSDGAQLHVQPSPDREPWSWLMVPVEEGDQVRATSTGAADAPPLATRWSAAADGWILRCELPLANVAPDGTFRLDVIVNEKPPGRERRRGQLVLSGARGEFVYLRGDRQPADRLLPFVIANG